MTTYLVTGNRGVRGYEPGETFEATLDPPVEARLVRRGNVRVVKAEKPTLQPGTYTLPDGWSTRKGEV